MPVALAKVQIQQEHGGHFGEKSTLTLMRRNYYWSSMSKDVQGWIEQCKSVRSGTETRG